MRNELAFASLILLAGCTSKQFTSAEAPLQSSQLNQTQFQRSMIHNPRVTFVGDSLTYQFLKYESPSHPLWINQATMGTETTGAMLARLPAALALHPDIIVILGGTYDSLSAGWDMPASPADIDTVNNLEAMGELAVAAGIPTILCTIPDIAEPAVDNLNLNHTPNVNNDLFALDYFSLYHPFYVSAQEAHQYPWIVVDYERGLDPLAGQSVDASVPPPGETLPWTDDGINPNQAGSDAMAAMLQPAIDAYKVGGLK